MINAVNFAAFQCGWFACVLGAAHGRPYAGIGAVAAIAIAHVATAVQPRAELALLGLAAGIGATWDSLLAATGWMSYAPGALVAGTAPLWIVALWVLFATTLNRSLAWLKPRLPLGAALGAIGGPLAYVGGERLGAISFHHEAAALMAQAIGWAVLTPLLLRLAQRHDGWVRELHGHSNVAARHD